MIFIRKSVQFQVFFLILSSLVILPGVMLAAEESITLTTYYPSPYGVYSEMRLYPKPGTTTPCDSLDPNTQKGVMFYDSDDNQLKVCGGSSPDWQPLGGGYWAAGSVLSSIYNTNLGNVGIGTNSPGQKLVVQAADTTSSTGTGATIHLQSDAVATTNRGGSVLFGDTGTTRSMIKGAYEGAGSSGYLALSTRTSAGVMTEALRINSSGNVGVGTTIPTSRMDVSGGAGTSVAVFENIPATGGAGGELLLQHRDNSGNRVTYASVKGYTTDGSAGTSGGALVFKTVDGALAERARIDRYGRFGIGTTDPTGKLTVSGNQTYASAAIGVKSTVSNGFSGIGFLDTAGTETAFMGYGQSSHATWPSRGVVGTSGSYPLTFATNNAERMRVDAAGNVGIGTTGPTHLLDVNGRARFRGGIQTGTGQLSAFCSGTPPVSCSNTSPVGTLYESCALSYMGGRDGVECEIVNLGGGRWRIEGRNNIGTTVKCGMTCIQYY